MQDRGFDYELGLYNWRVLVHELPEYLSYPL